MSDSGIAILSPTATEAMNISGSERLQVEDAIKSKNLEASIRIYCHLQSLALDNIHRDVYPRFLQSDGTEFASKFKYLPIRF